jgi:hypothetical protein
VKFTLTVELEPTELSKVLTSVLERGTVVVGELMNAGAKLPEIQKLIEQVQQAVHTPQPPWKDTMAAAIAAAEATDKSAERA